MHQDDYIIKLIKSGVKAAVGLFAGKDAIKTDIDIQNYNLNLSQDELLEFMIKKYLSQGKINEAENLLFEVMEIRKTRKNLETALFFYTELSKWDEDKLMKYNFSRLEVEKGLKDIKKLYKQNAAI